MNNLQTRIKQIKNDKIIGTDFPINGTAKSHQIQIFPVHERPSISKNVKFIDKTLHLSKNS